MKKKLDDKLKSNPNSLYCYKPEECIGKVAQTGKSVYIHVSYAQHNVNILLIKITY